MSIADGCADLYSKNLIKCIETRERIGIGMVTVENKRSWGLVAGSVETGPETVVSTANYSYGERKVRSIYWNKWEAFRHRVGKTRAPYGYQGYYNI